MSDSSKKQGAKQDQPRCECECANCDIGAHERCNSPKCKMPKWKDIRTIPKKRSR